MLPLAHFSPRRLNPDGLHHHCKPCVALYMRERYARDVVQRPKVLRWNEANRRRNREAFEAWIADKSCVDCGTTERREFTLDHVRGEKRATSKRWAKCKRCGARVERRSLDDVIVVRRRGAPDFRAWPAAFGVRLPNQ